MSDRGVLFIAEGDRAKEMVRGALDALGQHSDIDWGVIDSPPNATGKPGRWAKVNLYSLSACEQTCYLDADTIAHEDIAAGFDLLDDGWDLVICPSAGDWLGHLQHIERDATERELGWQPLQLQGGVFWFKRSDAIRRFFEAWREEWQRFEDEDQGALLRALYRCPIRVWLMGRPWNGGEVIEHNHGALR